MFRIYIYIKLYEYIIFMFHYVCKFVVIKNLKMFILYVFTSVIKKVFLTITLTLDLN